MSRAIRWLDLDALLREPAPEVEWVVKWLLARGHLTLLNGGHGVGKSFLATAIAVAVAHGAEAIAGLPIIGGPVVILDAENGQRTFHERAHLAGLPADRVRAGLAEDFDLRQPAAIEELRAAFEPDPPALLVLDSLASLAPGLKENEADQVAPVLDRIRRLAQSTGAAILLLHHARKDGDSYRGGTAIPAAADVVAVYARPRDTLDRERRVIDWSHDRGGKMRLGPQPEPHHLRVAVTAGRLTIDAADPPAGDTPSAPPTRRDQLRAQALDVVAEHGPIRQTDLLRQLKLAPTDRTGRRALEDAERAEQLTRQDDGHYTIGRQGANGACHSVAQGMAVRAPVGGACLPAHRRRPRRALAGAGLAGLPPHPRWPAAGGPARALLPLPAPGARGLRAGRGRRSG